MLLYRPDNQRLSAMAPVQILQSLHVQDEAVLVVRSASSYGLGQSEPRNLTDRILGCGFAHAHTL